ncbi:MAG: DMT family transporter [Erysipelotrichaceae bacterium]|nr:DMT family transporter [Erysipelotrichaceae bacterium]
MLSGLLSGVFWAFDTVIISIILGKITGDARVMLIAPLVSTFLHDLCSSIFMLVYMGIKGKLKETFNTLKTRGGKFIMLAAILGGPIGMSAYITAIGLIGPSLTAIISSLYPALGSLMAWIFLKEKRKPYQIIALFIAIGAIILLGYTNDGQITNLWLGIALALICVIAWASEGVICTYGLQNENVNNEVALQIRQTISMIFYALVIINLFKAWGLTSELISSNLILIVFISAFFGTISYLFYYRSFQQIGASKTMALNISYSAFAIIVSFFILKTVPSLKDIILGLVIVGSGLISAYDK